MFEGLQYGAAMVIIIDAVLSIYCLLGIMATVVLASRAYSIQRMRAETLSLAGAFLSSFSASAALFILITFNETLWSFLTL